MPGFVRLTRAKTGESYYEALDLIASFQDAAIEIREWKARTPASMIRIFPRPENAGTAIYVVSPFSTRPPHVEFVIEDPDTVQARIREELQRIGSPPMSAPVAEP